MGRQETPGRDMLTGLADRRTFRAALQAPVRGRPALLAADLDRLDQINRIHGYLFGDACIRRAAELLLAAAEGEGTAFRATGDCLALLCAGEGEARAAACRLTDALAREEETTGLALTATAAWAAFAPGTDRDLADTWQRARQMVEQDKWKQD